MSATLENRVACYVHDHPGLTCQHIAAELRAREQSVRDILASPAFKADEGPGRSLTFTLAVGASESLPFAPRKSERSQADRMLELLEDGRWHSISELWTVGVGRPNSRAAELRPRLRSQGLTVEHRQDTSRSHPSGQHQYRLVALDTAAGSPGARRVESAAASSAETLGEGKDEFGTLSESGPVGNAGPPSFPSPSGPSARPGSTSEVGSPAGGPVPLSPRDNRVACPTDLGADRVGVGAAVQPDGQLALVAPEFRKAAAA